MRDDSRRTQPTSLTASDLASFFTSKIDAIRASTANSDTATYKKRTDAKFCDFTPCAATDIRRIINQSPGKSCQLDPLPTELLKASLDDLLPILTTICNQSLLEGVLPISQKSAIITPILKKAGLDPDVAANYRPISNLTFISKVIERIVAGQLTAYLVANNLLPTRQSAYRAHHSTETALLGITSAIFDAADKADVTLLAALDLSAAFDCVDHHILLERLRISYGLGGCVLDWIASFLHDRSQTVSFAGGLSAASTVLYGVPQGSVLGPLLYVLYTADVCDIAASHQVHIHCYADDIQLYKHCAVADIDTTTRNILACIEAIDQWMSSNRLKLNASKTQFAWFGSWQQLSKFKPQPLRTQTGDDILPCDKLCSLGLNLDSQLTMEAHVNNVVRSCSFQLRQLRSIRQCLTTEAATALVHAFVISRVDYCNSVFFRASDRVHRKLQSVLNSAARLITGRRLYDHITPIMRDELHWLPVSQRIAYKLAVITHNCLRGLGPQYLLDMLQQIAGIPHCQHLRSAQHGDLAVARLRTSCLGARSFSQSSAAVWNSLPQHFGALIYLLNSLEKI